MKEEIKNLEEIINLCKEEINNNDKNITATLDLEDLKSLKNFLDRYKQLEEENKELTDAYMIQKHLINAEFLSDYIPKSKVKEKIEELSNEEDTKYILSKTNRIIYKIDIIDILQDLLGKE